MYVQTLPVSTDPVVTTVQIASVSSVQLAQASVYPDPSERVMIDAPESVITGAKVSPERVSTTCTSRIPEPALPALSTFRYSI